MVRRDAIALGEPSIEPSRRLHLPVNFACQRVDRSKGTEPRRRESGVIVRILEVWFLSSVPIGIAVGRLLERGSAPVLDGTPQVARSVASAER
jgi:hypothetical protein